MPKIALAKKLRKEMTDAERTLWTRLRGKRFLGNKFRRQHPLGPFIVDFVCLNHGLVIEVDGGHHNDTLEYDLQRTQWLESKGFKILRFWNHEVLKCPAAVLGRIHQALSPHLSPPPQSGGGNRRGAI